MIAKVESPAIFKAHPLREIANLVHLAVQPFQVDQDLFNVRIQFLLALDQFLGELLAVVDLQAPELGRKDAEKQQDHAPE